MEKTFKSFLSLKSTVTLPELIKVIQDIDMLYKLITKYIKTKNSRIKYKCLQIICHSDNVDLTTRFYKELKMFIQYTLHQYCHPPKYNGLMRQLVFKLVENGFNDTSHPRVQMTYYHLRKSYPEFITIIQMETNKRVQLQEAEASKERFLNYATQEFNLLQDKSDTIISHLETIFYDYYPSLDSINPSNTATLSQMTGITKAFSLDITINNSKYILTTPQTIYFQQAKETIEFELIPKFNFLLHKLNEFLELNNPLIVLIETAKQSLLDIMDQMKNFTQTTTTKELFSSADDDFEEVVITATPEQQESINIGRKRKRPNPRGLLK